MNTPTDTRHAASLLEPAKVNAGDMLYTSSQAQPQPVQPQGPMAETVEEAARDVAKCLNERDGQGLDLRHVAMLVNHAQQPVQEPVAWSERIKELADQYAIECVEFSKGIPNGAHSMSPIAVKAGDTRLALHSAIDTGERFIRAIESATLAAQVERATQPQPVQEPVAVVKWQIGGIAVHIVGDLNAGDMLYTSPQAQPQPVPPEGPMAETVEQAARDVAKCLNERDGQGLDLRHVAMLVNHAQHPVQQEPIGVVVAIRWDDSGKTTRHAASLLESAKVNAGDMLYTSPQAQPAQQLTETQADALNALCKMLHSGEEVEGDDGLAMLVPMDLWNEAQEAIELLIGEDDGTEAAHGITKGKT